VYACTHDIGQCSCRKPQTGLFLQALAAFPGLTFDDAVLIGDSLCDLDAGSRIGSRSFLIADEERASVVLGEATRRGIPVSGTAPSLDTLVRNCLLPSTAHVRA
jgi:histidinol phosphatase-like enzyme